MLALVIHPLKKGFVGAVKHSLALAQQVLLIIVEEMDLPLEVSVEMV